jgi:uncharacterized protein YdhG (YjbR/CyaY superfamily)
MKPAPTVAAYLAAQPPKMRAALQRLRKTIKAAAPGATEGISYQIPTFKLNGLLVSYAAWKDHCAIYALSAKFVRTHAAQLKRFEVSKGTIRFSPDEPLPAALVTKLVKARIADNAARQRKAR